MHGMYDPIIQTALVYHYTGNNILLDLLESRASDCVVHAVAHNLLTCVLLLLPN